MCLYSSTPICLYYRPEPSIWFRLYHEVMSHLIPHAHKLVKFLNTVAATQIPPNIKEKPGMPPSVLHDGAVGDTQGPLNHQPSPPLFGAQEKNNSVTFDFGSEEVSPEEADPFDVTGIGSDNNETGDDPVIDGTGAHAFGQATCNQSGAESDDNEDLFGDVE